MTVAQLQISLLIAVKPECPSVRHKIPNHEPQSQTHITVNSLTY